MILVNISAEKYKITGCFSVSPGPSDVLYSKQIYITPCYTSSNSYQ
jgi:hypothetical protein